MGQSGPIDLRFSRIYLDTNILIAALLERDIQWKKKKPKMAQQKSDFIEASSRIFRGWHACMHALE